VSIDITDPFETILEQASRIAVLEVENKRLRQELREQKAKTEDIYRLAGHYRELLEAVGLAEPASEEVQRGRKCDLDVPDKPKTSWCNTHQVYGCPEAVQR
jgi:hypothetical protein